MDEPSERQVTPKEGRAGERLDSLKEIAAHLRRDVRTVQRWEERESLLVHRHLHHERASVYGYKSELDSWLENGRPGLEDDQPMGWVSFLGKNPKTTIYITMGSF